KETAELVSAPISVTSPVSRKEIQSTHEPLLLPATSEQPSPVAMPENETDPTTSPVKSTSAVEKHHSDTAVDTDSIPNMTMPDVVPFDVDGGMVLDQSESDEEERRKRLVRMALAEAKGAALLVAEGLPASEAVLDESSPAAEDPVMESPVSGKESSDKS